MHESVALGLRVLSTAAFDWGLAFGCGLMLAAYWLRAATRAPDSVEVRTPRLLWAAALMVVAVGCQFYLLVVTMADEPGLLGVLHSAAAVASTHAGTMMLWTLGVAGCLLLVTSLRIRTIAATGLSVGLLGVILLLHSAMGHAARDGNFSWAELLQFIHLSGMALWTGGVIVSGLVILPRLVVAGGMGGGYLRALSRVSAYSLGVVLLSGALKGWDGLNGHVSGLLHTAWGLILLVKLLFVGVAIGLGFVHRRWIGRRGDEWIAGESRMMLATLRVEAVCLAVVIVVSAWLGSVSPPGD